MAAMGQIKNIIIGRSRNPQDKTVFHKLSLIAFLAWIGLGADGLSSSCYGPQEAFLALNGHVSLSIFVALGTILTICIISASYSQIVELFPTGGGGYLVASKLLSPELGMLSGCALIIDYVLTISVSIASGADAIFSILPLQWYSYKLAVAIAVIIVLIVLNMRGVKESVLVLAPIFLTFLITHIFIIIYAFASHPSGLTDITFSVRNDMHSAISQIGLFGMIFLILRAYTMGAGTYTGLEAVSNSIPVLREPRVHTAKSTMRYMAVSLSFIVMGLMCAYLLFKVTPRDGKTLNAILFENATALWTQRTGYFFILIALISEAAFLFVAAQTGFLGGPMVLANMAKDRWFPTRFFALSDRLVIQNGIFIMGALALVIVIATKGSVRLLVLLYSINVFITFTLSQLGMVRHWWLFRAKVRGWRSRLLVSGIGLVLTFFILVSMLVFKFNEGGWITLLITGGLVGVAIAIKRHYYKMKKLLRRLNGLVVAAESEVYAATKGGVPEKRERLFDTDAKTAVILVSGFNGTGLHTLLGIIRLFGGAFKNFIFVEIGVVDAGNFKGTHEMERLAAQVKSDLNRYESFVRRQGFYGEGISGIGVDVIGEVDLIAPKILERFPDAVFFGGQLIFPKDSFVLRSLHNHTVFALQKRLYRQGIPFVMLPIRV